MLTSDPTLPPIPDCSKERAEQRTGQLNSQVDTMY